MKEKIKKYLFDLVVYVNVGAWIGAGCAIGFWAVTVLYMNS